MTFLGLLLKNVIVTVFCYNSLKSLMNDYFVNLKATFLVVMQPKHKIFGHFLQPKNDILGPKFQPIFAPLTNERLIQNVFFSTYSSNFNNQDQESFACFSLCIASTPVKLFIDNWTTLYLLYDLKCTLMYSLFWIFKLLQLQRK